MAPCDLGIATVPPNVDAQIRAFCPSELPQSLDEGCHIRLKYCLGRRGVHEDANPPDSLAPLRAHGKWPCCRRAREPRNEFAPSHPFPSQLIYGQPIAVGIKWERANTED